MQATMMQVKIAEACVRHGKRLIQFSSCEVYGKTAASILSEELKNSDDPALGTIEPTGMRLHPDHDPVLMHGASHFASPDINILFVIFALAGIASVVGRLRERRAPGQEGKAARPRRHAASQLDLEDHRARPRA